MCDSFHKFLVGRTKCHPHFWGWWEGEDVKNVEKMFSKPHKRKKKKGKVASQAFISHVYVTVSSLKIAVNTVPIFLT